MYKINQKILQTPISDGKVLLLEPQNGLYFELNEVSVIIYQCLSDGCSKRETIIKITNEFEVCQHEAESDFEDLMQELIENNIVLLEAN